MSEEKPKEGEPHIPSGGVSKTAATENDRQRRAKPGIALLGSSFWEGSCCCCRSGCSFPGVSPRASEILVADNRHGFWVRGWFASLRSKR